jgi:phosphatidyl-myo-inositol dimannoside synthase
MKTLVISHDLFGAEGGIARIMRLYVKALAEKAEHRTVSYVALNDQLPSARNDFLNRDALATEIGCRGSKWRFAWAVFRHGLRADRAACGHLHHLALLRLVKVLRPRFQYYLVAHGIEVWRPYSAVEQWALRGASRILCVSEYTRRQMLRFSASLAPESLSVVPNTFDPRFDQRNAAPMSSGFRAGPAILVVSRLVSTDPYKGVDTMIEAMPLLKRTFPEVRLTIVGGGDDTPRLKGIAEHLRLENSVTFTGVVSDDLLSKHYQRCDLFALPSRKEGFGLVYLEAMAYGKPCLAARAGGAPEVVNDSVGALVEYGNVEQIAIAVSDLVHHPRERDAIIRHARSFTYTAFRDHLQRVLSHAA